MGVVTGSSVESNGYFAETNLPIEVAEDDAVSGIKYHRHGDQIYSRFHQLLFAVQFFDFYVCIIQELYLTSLGLSIS